MDSRTVKSESLSPGMILMFSKLVLLLYPVINFSSDIREKSSKKIFLLPPMMMITIAWDIKVLKSRLCSINRCRPPLFAPTSLISWLHTCRDASEMHATSKRKSCQRSTALSHIIAVTPWTAQTTLYIILMPKYLRLAQKVMMITPSTRPAFPCLPLQQLYISSHTEMLFLHPSRCCRLRSLLCVRHPRWWVRGKLRIWMPSYLPTMGFQYKYRKRGRDSLTSCAPSAPSRM